MAKQHAILYVPSDTPEAMVIATMKIAGVPAIVRGIMTLMQAGIDKCTILIAEPQRAKIESFLERYRVKLRPQIEILCYDEPYRMSPDIVGKIGTTLDGNAILINANLLFEKDFINSITAMSFEDGGVVLCLEGVHPLPVMNVSPSAWNRLAEFTEERPRSIESCLKFLAQTSKQGIFQKNPSVSVFLIKRLRDRAVAEKFLIEAIRHSAQGPVAMHINKRISLPISLFLCKLWISPNAVTAVNIIIGLFSGVFVADGHNYKVILFGAILFQIASIVDGCDGEVAKLTFRCSKFGQYIDSLSDNLSLGSFMTGLIAGYWRHTHSPVAFYAGAVMLFGTAVTLFWMIRYLKRNTQSASLVTFDKEYLEKLSGQPRPLLLFIKYGKVAMKKDVFSFMFLLFAIAGILYWWLFIAAFGTTVSAIILTYLNAKTWIKESVRNLESEIRSEK